MLTTKVIAVALGSVAVGAIAVFGWRGAVDHGRAVAEMAKTAVNRNTSLDHKYRVVQQTLADHWNQIQGYETALAAAEEELRQRKAALDSLEKSIEQNVEILRETRRYLEEAAVSGLVVINGTTYEPAALKTDVAERFAAVKRLIARQDSEKAAFADLSLAVAKNREKLAQLKSMYQARQGEADILRMQGMNAELLAGLSRELSHVASRQGGVAESMSLLREHVKRAELGVERGTEQSGVQPAIWEHSTKTLQAEVDAFLSTR